ncbi:unnamed protein product [Nezara viridula]|uniref:Uncharacterized protein n=1 Tax=Nezara viridula TaxID=85310 RepID=A0A9P0EC76_NEZVI|nr:unnamed protein product [Nezara viridula]
MTLNKVSRSLERAAICRLPPPPPRGTQSRSDAAPMTIIPLTVTLAQPCLPSADQPVPRVTASLFISAPSGRAWSVHRISPKKDNQKEIRDDVEDPPIVSPSSGGMAIVLPGLSRSRPLPHTSSEGVHFVFISTKTVILDILSWQIA